MKNAFIEKRSNIIWIASAVTFFMFIFNCLTLYCADDYSYHYNLLDGTRVENLRDIIQALYSNYVSRNGRVVSHFFAYFFLLLPKFVFNITNSIMFLVQMILSYKIIKRKSDNCIIFGLFFVFIWLYEPAFGQVNLWLDGACNYLFALVFGLLFFYSFVREWEEPKKGNWGNRILWCVYSFCFGAYSENLSFSVIMGALAIVLVIIFFEKRKVSCDMILKIVFAFGGYAFLALAPTTIHNNAAAFSISYYLYNFQAILQRYWTTFMVLILAWIVSLVIACYLKIEKKRILLSTICVLISLCNTLMCCVAAYLSNRSMCGSALFLVIAVLLLFYDIWDSDFQIVISCFSACILFVFSVYFVAGTYDITWTYNKTARRTAYLEECAKQGEKEVYVEWISPLTKYSSSHRLPDLDTQDATVWPNESYERYFGIESIYGIDVNYTVED